MLSSSPKYSAWASNPTRILFNGYWKAIFQVLKCQYQATDHSSMWTGLHLLICTSYTSRKWNVHQPFIITQWPLRLLNNNLDYLLTTVTTPMAQSKFSCDLKKKSQNRQTKSNNSWKYLVLWQHFCHYGQPAIQALSQDQEYEQLCKEHCQLEC